MDGYGFEMPIWESVLRGTLVYFIVAMVFRLLPKRQAGNLAPNDMIALVIAGSLAADAVKGQSSALADLVLMVLVIVSWDYLANLAEFHIPRFRRIVQASPTLLIHDGVLLKENLQREKLTEQELAANLRKQGVSDIAAVRQAVLEADGHVSVVKYSK